MPNDSGLFDMYGNVSEWNADAPDGANHVFTSGGGFKALPQEFSSHYSMMTSPDLEYNQFGFRVARTIELNENGAAPVTAGGFAGDASVGTRSCRFEAFDGHV